MAYKPLVQSADLDRDSLKQELNSNVAQMQVLEFQRQAFLKIELIGFNPPVFVFGQAFA